MGASTSILSSEELYDLAKQSNFSNSEIEVLFKRFTQLNRSKSGLLSSSELQLIPELSMNPLCPRIIALFDPEGTDQINFHRFVQSLSLFSSKASQEQKLRVLFTIFDVDGDGLISENDLFHVLKLLVGSNLSDTELLALVRKTMVDAAGSKDAVGLKFESFSKVFGDGASALVIEMHLGE